MNGRHSLANDELHQGHSGVAAGGYAGARRLSGTTFSDSFPTVIVPPVSTSSQTQFSGIGSLTPGPGVRRSDSNSPGSLPSLEPLPPPPVLESLTADKNETMGVSLQSITGTEEQTTAVPELTADERPPLEELREQDRFLPIANVSRIMKKVIPQNGKIAKDAKECMQECVSEFISFITSEASERCQQEKRKTINGEDILFAMTTLGFDNYIEPLKHFLNQYRENVRGAYPKDPSALANGSEDLPSGVHQLTESLTPSVYSFQSQPSVPGAEDLAGQGIPSLSVDDGRQSESDASQQSYILIPQNQVPMLQ